jgi:hypothetical protein
MVEGADTAVYNKKQKFRFPYCGKDDTDHRQLKRAVLGEDGRLVIYETIKEAFAATGESMSDWTITSIQKRGKTECECEKCQPMPAEEDKADDDADGKQRIFNWFIDKHPEYKFLRYRDYNEQYKRIRCYGQAGDLYCDICQRTHTRDNSVYIQLGEMGIMRGCFKTPNILKETRCVKAKPEQFTNERVIRFNEQYCSAYEPLMKEQGDIVLKAGTGIGKSYAMREKTQSNERVLLISFRVSLAKMYERQYGYESYLTDRKRTLNNNITKLICQIDSLHRLRWKEHGTVVIDEINQVRRHMTSDSFLRNPNYKRSVAVFENVVRSCKQLIVMSAHVSDRDIAWLRSIRYGFRPTVFINERVLPLGMCQVRTETYILQHATEALRAGKSAYIACNGSVKNSAALFKTLVKQCPTLNENNSLLINKDTQGEANVKQALTNATVEWGKYKLIVCSPSVQSGISYDLPWDNVYGLFNNWTNSSEDAVQMLRRIRNPAFVAVSLKQSRRVDSRQLSEQLLAKSVQAEHVLQGDWYGNLFNIEQKGDKFFLENSPLLNNILKNKIEENEDHHSYVENVLRALREEGYQLSVDKQKGDGEVGKQIKKQKAEDFTEHCRGLEQTPLLVSSEEEEAIKERMKDGNASKEDKLKLEKVIIQNTYDIPKEEYEKADSTWFALYGPKRVRQHFSNQKKMLLPPEQLKENEQRQWERLREANKDNHDEQDEAILLAKRKLKYKKYERIGQMLTCVGFDDGILSEKEVVPDKKMLESRFYEGKALEETNLAFDTRFAYKQGKSDPIKYLNGTLRSEFGCSIVKKHRNKNKRGDDIQNKLYVMKNEHETLFRTGDGDALKPRLIGEDAIPDIVEGDDSSVYQMLVEAHL